MFVLLVFNSTAFAQSDSLILKPKWYLPKGVLAEYAGGFGIMSVGAIYIPIKQTELTLSIGYTPPAYGKIWTANILGSYKPFRVKLNEEFSIIPLNLGAFANFNFGDNIHLLWPDKYPDDYYFWNSSLRFGPFLNTELSFDPKQMKSTYTFFFQCLTNDLYIANYLPNTHSLSFSDILILGIGFKFLY